MAGRFLDIVGLLRTPVGRTEILGGIFYRAWPLTSALAALNRRTRGREVRVAAVVGSYGKSTTTHCIAVALGRAIRDPGWNNRSTIARKVLALRPGDACAVMEVGIDGPGQMLPMARTIRPDIAVVTTIGTEHHRSLGTLETTRHEKAQMVRALAPSGVAILNGDDPHVMWMSGETRARVVTYGLGTGHDVRGSEIQLEPDGQRLRVHTRGETTVVRTRLIGRHMVYPVLAAIAVALECGFSLEQCAARLEAVEPVAARMRVQRLSSGALLVCDYHKSSYETVLAALDAIAEMPAQRRIVVLGDVSEPPGSQGPIYRGIGERLAPVASRVIVFGTGFQRYKAGATQAGMPSSALIDAGHRVLDAIEAIPQDLGPGDIVLIKGRDTQRLDRVALALSGRSVGCTIPACYLKRTRCDRCPMFEPGWRGIRVTT